MVDLLPPVSTSLPARDRLIRAALTIFSRDGLQRATTKAIAEEADVNEVTLFRLFGTKDGLLGALLSHLVSSAVGAATAETDDEAWSSASELRDDLLRFGQRHYALLTESESLIRTMIGEAHRYPEHARKIVHDAGKPVHERFIANLEAARRAGKVREGVDLTLAAQAYMDMLFSGMLRYTAGFCDAGNPQDFIKTCADIFAAGLAPSPRTPTQKTSK